MVLNLSKSKTLHAIRMLLFQIFPPEKLHTFHKNLKSPTLVMTELSRWHNAHT